MIGRPSIEPVAASIKAWQWLWVIVTAAIIVAGHASWAAERTSAQIDGAFVAAVIVDLIPCLVYSVLARRQLTILILGPVLAILGGVGWSVAITSTNDMRLAVPMLTWLASVTVVGAAVATDFANLKKSQ